MFVSSFYVACSSVGSDHTECRTKKNHKHILSQKRNATCGKIYFTSNFQHHFEYRNKHYIIMKFGTLVVQTLKFLKMSQFITLMSIAFRWRHFKSQYLLCPTLTCNTGRICLGIDSINRQIRSCRILPHSCSWACCSSCRVCGTGWRLCTRRSTSSINVLLG